jgi:hypothetical protein
MDTVLSFQTVSRRSSLRSENQELLLESTCRIAPVLTLQASGRGGVLSRVQTFVCSQLASKIAHIYLSVLQGVWTGPQPRPASCGF